MKAKQKANKVKVKNCIKGWTNQELLSIYNDHLGPNVTAQYYENVLVNAVYKIEINIEIESQSGYILLYTDDVDHWRTLKIGYLDDPFWPAMLADCQRLCDCMINEEQ